MDFYFYVLEKYPQYRAQFEMLRHFYEIPLIQAEFLALESDTEKINFLTSLATELSFAAPGVFATAHGCLDFFKVLVAQLVAKSDRKISNLSKS